MTFDILLVEPGGRSLAPIARFAREAGIPDLRLDHCETLGDAVGRLVEMPADLVLLALDGPDADGLNGLLRLQCTAPDTPVLPFVGGSNGPEAMRFDVADGTLLTRTLARLYRHRQDQRRLVHRATHDRLTGLANRWLLEEKITDAASRSRRYGEPGALLFVDLDGFKSVNDRYGHDAGDVVLKTVACRLRDSVRACDTVARYGGDEFVVLLEQLRDERAALRVVAKLEQRLAEPIHLPHGTISVTASFGVAFFPMQGENLDALLRRADRLMYRRKIERRTGAVA